MKVVGSLLVLAFLAYAAICALLYFNQRGMIYYPQFTRVDAAQTDFEMQREGIVLRGWLLNPGKAKAIVYFGGNGESIQNNRDDFLRWFPDHTVYLVAYRGYGASDGEPSEPALFADALAVFDRAQSEHPEKPVAVIGRSLGSGVAAHVASKRPIDRLVLITPFDTLADVGQMHYRWLPVRWLATDRYDSVANLADYQGPLLVIRAGRDEVIPAANTERLITSLRKPPQVIVLPSAGHNDLGEDPVYGKALTDFLR
ncbi:MAG TPA: alpha/beta fold hydrolase [Luteimonas sp.]|nr:alpha/beta fold hydrolase [Luteimonas sp.]